jgi:hypothetical protein
VVFAWIFFRANSVTHALSYISKIFSASLFSGFNLDVNRSQLFETILLVILFLVVEWLGRENPYAISALPKLQKRSYRMAFYYLLVFLIFLFTGKEQQFIYFQF